MTRFGSQRHSKKKKKMQDLLYDEKVKFVDERSLTYVCWAHQTAHPLHKTLCLKHSESTHINAHHLSLQYCRLRRNCSYSKTVL